MRTLPIPAELIDKIWPMAYGFIASACARSGGEESADDLYAKVKAGQGHVLVILEDRAVCILERDGDALHCTSLAGQDVVRNIVEFVDVWRTIAKDVGASRLTLKGRKGWSRVFAGHGFKMNDDGFLEGAAI
jgi:hypothetical protein